MAGKINKQLNSFVQKYQEGGGPVGQNQQLGTNIEEIVNNDQMLELFMQRYPELGWTNDRDANKTLFKDYLIRSSQESTPTPDQRTPQTNNFFRDVYNKSMSGLFKIGQASPQYMIGKDLLKLGNMDYQLMKELLGPLIDKIQKQFTAPSKTPLKTPPVSEEEKKTPLTPEFREGGNVPNGNMLELILENIRAEADVHGRINQELLNYERRKEFRQK